MGSLDSWCSPAEVADPLEEYCDGPVGLDPCSNERSIIRAEKAYVGKVGLILPWDPRRRRSVYENPPYSQLDAFTDKGIRELRVGPDLDLIRLVPVATSTGWFRRMLGIDPVLVPDGLYRPGFTRIYAPKPLVIYTKRLKFINEKGETDDSARFDSILVLYTRSKARRRRFVRVYKSITSWTQGESL